MAQEVVEVIFTPWPWDENVILREALNHIGSTCEHFTYGSCLDEHSGKTRDAKYWADRWCVGCIVADALAKMDGR